ncbi:hypothetical protein [Dyella acidiphila]|uniref:Peptidase C39-like domain-containing protein n=1 Tax=Dyella acidiphila TaxID=2775866 RepID=A0ABR9G9M2_9GAMM|nr:hypothetical protein [Dyella acidiphila]MBE1160747.1 hypothetical protein [Dyella acidiphila]
MPSLQNFPAEVSQFGASSWVGAARAIVNWYYMQGLPGVPCLSTDQDLGTAWMMVSQNMINSDIYVQQSAVQALEALGFSALVAELPVPSTADIGAALGNGDPLLVLIGAIGPSPEAAPDINQGQWVVIVGIADGGSSTLQVFDPRDGAIHEASYNSATYQPDEYWQQTSFIYARR